MGEDIKKVEISFIYRKKVNDTAERDKYVGRYQIFNIVGSFNNMLSDLPPEIRNSIEDIELKISDLGNDKFDLGIS